MNVFVAGGTGAIGRHAVPTLLEAGHAVTALARTRVKAVTLKEQGAEPISVCIYDRAGLRAALAGRDAVNLATARLSIHAAEIMAGERSRPNRGLGLARGRRHHAQIRLARIISTKAPGRINNVPEPSLPSRPVS